MDRQSELNNHFSKKDIHEWIARERALACDTLVKARRAALQMSEDINPMNSKPAQFMSHSTEPFIEVVHKRPLTALLGSLALGALAGYFGRDKAREVASQITLPSLPEIGNTVSNHLQAKGGLDNVKDNLNRQVEDLLQSGIERVFTVLKQQFGLPLQTKYTPPLGPQ